LKEARKCHRFSVQFQKDAQVRIGAGVLVYTVSFTKALKEGLCRIEGRMKKGEMAGLGSANGRV
jgi:hypothetical protein